MENKCILAVDAGGTFFKFALLDETYDVLFEGECPACSDGGIGDIENAWKTLLRTAQMRAGALGRAIGRLAVSSPGPYDFEKGIPLMKHKFASAYGVSVLPWIAETLPGVHACFMHDLTAFMLGQLLFGAAKGAARPAAVTLGTGFGFANVVDGRIAVNSLLTTHIPVWKMPFEGGITEDFVSRRAIRAAYRRLSGCDEGAVPDVKEIASRAQAGEGAAQQTFSDMGAYFGRIIRPVLLSLDADRLILGGQIAKAHALFEGTLLPYLPCPMVLAQDGEAAALKGAAAYSVLGAERALQIYQD